MLKAKKVISSTLKNLEEKLVSYSNKIDENEIFENDKLFD